MDAVDKNRIRLHAMYNLQHMFNTLNGQNIQNNTILHKIISNQDRELHCPSSVIKGREQAEP